MIDLNEPYDVYVPTEVGDVSHGGVSVWVDYWVQNVAFSCTKPIFIDRSRTEGRMGFIC